MDYSHSADLPQQVFSTLRVRRRSGQPKPSEDLSPSALEVEDHPALVLDGVGLELVSISVDGHRLEDHDYDITADSLTVLRPPGATFIVGVTVRIKPQCNTSLLGLYR